MRARGREVFVFEGGENRRVGPGKNMTAVFCQKSKVKKMKVF